MCSLVQYVAEDNPDKIGLRAVPRLDVVAVPAVEIFLVHDREVDLASGAASQQEEGGQMTCD